jgi:hypothetical protein
MKKTLPALLILLLLSACMTAQKVISYYVDKGVMQYYLVPSDLKGTDAKVSVDFTIRMEKDVKKPAICNFTIQGSKEIPRMITRARFHLVDINEYVDLNGIDVLYIEKARNEIRFTSTIDQDAFKRILVSRKIELLMSSENKDYVFTPTRGFYDVVEKASGEIIDDIP